MDVVWHRASKAKDILKPGPGIFGHSPTCFVVIKGIAMPRGGFYDFKRDVWHTYLKSHNVTRKVTHFARFVLPEDTPHD